MYWNPAAQKVGMRPSVQNNYTKKEITLLPKYTPLYVWRLYGDLEAELDFPSCEISFCSPAGQLHHFPCFPIFHSRLSSHTRTCVLHVLHGVASIMLHVADAGGGWRGGAELGVCHFNSSTSATRTEISQHKAAVEQHLNASRWDWQRYFTLLMKMNKGIYKCQTPHLKKVSSISQWNQRIFLYNMEWILSGWKKMNA